MTLEDSVKANPTFVNVPDIIIERAFINRGVEMTDDYTVDRQKDVDLVSADLYLELATQPSYSEGELSVTFNVGVLLNRARNIYSKYDDAKYEEVGYSKINLNITKQ